MKQIEVKNKKVVTQVRLMAHLVQNGFKVLGVLSQDGAPPSVWVTMEDSETKDPTPVVRAYADPCLIAVASSQPVGLDQVPQCAGDGVAVHLLHVRKLDPVTRQLVVGGEMVRVYPSTLIKVSPSVLKLADGIGSLTIGPTTMVGELSVRLLDEAGNLAPTAIVLRFI